MKKTTPYYLVGILFVTVFLGLVGISKLSGLWVAQEGHGQSRHGSTEMGKPAGRPPTQEFGSEEDLENMTRHFSNMTISEFCQIAGIDSECALSKLGLSQSDITSTFSDIEKKKSTTMAQMMKMIQDCSSAIGYPESDFDDKGGEDR
jgi:hypothetical protein